MSIQEKENDTVGVGVTEENSTRVIEEADVVDALGITVEQ